MKVYNLVSFNIWCDETITIIKIFITPPNFHMLHFHTILFPNNHWFIDYFAFSGVLYYISYNAFFSLPAFIQHTNSDVARINSSVSTVGWYIPLCGYTTMCLSIYLLTDIWIVSDEHSQVSFCLDICFYFSVYIPRSEMTGSYGLCLISKKLPNYFPKRAYHFIYPPVNYASVSSSTSSFGRVFWILVILVGMWYYFIVVLVCIFLMTSSDEQIFICLFDTHLSSLM